MGALDRWLARRILAVQGGLPVRLVLWNGEVLGPGAGEVLGTLTVQDPATLRRIVLRPETGLPEAYVDGSLGFEGDLPALMTQAYQSERVVSWQAWASRLALGVLRRNTLRGSRVHVHHHYDLGNEFYARWLDERMVYTCGYYPRPDAGLAEAQLAKLDLVCRKLRLRPGERVLETGCGWGSLALHMAGRYGCRVRAFNISSEQIAWARDRAKKLGLVGRVEFVEDDYRNVSGRYDAFVSVGMLEHVGRAHHRVVGKVIHDSLEADGRGLLHSIGRAAPARLHPWIEKNIFPGGYPPTLREMLEIIEPFDLVVLDAENLRLHYARTLQHWLARFERHTDEFSRRFGEPFVRMWRLYLAGSFAAYQAGSLQLFQLLFARRRTREIAWTREHLYRALATRDHE